MYHSHFQAKTYHTVCVKMNTLVHNNFLKVSLLGSFTENLKVSSEYQKHLLRIRRLHRNWKACFEQLEGFLWRTISFYVCTLLKTFLELHLGLPAYSMYPEYQEWFWFCFCFFKLWDRVVRNAIFSGPEDLGPRTRGPKLAYTVYVYTGDTIFSGPEYQGPRTRGPETQGPELAYSVCVRTEYTCP